MAPTPVAAEAAAIPLGVDRAVVLGVLNVAHGSLYAFGGYTAATLVAAAGGASANVAVPVIGP